MLVGAVLAVFAATVAAIASLAQFGRWPTLREWPFQSPKRWPRVSVIVPSRNEAEDVERGVRSLLAQDYPDLEIVAINDRSTDPTGPILDRLASEDRRLRVVHVKDLPGGWLGKNNAMRRGAEAASGEWLLFTDGDVLFEPEALRRSVAFAEEFGLGHFVAAPHLLTSGYWERAFVSGAFGLSFALITRIHRLHVAQSRAFIGVGAFGLVRRSAYDAIGGHSRLALEVGDDVKLGLILRRSGVRQGALDSDGLVRVRWQRGLRGCILGLEKNGFAGVEWNAAAGVAAILLCFTLAWLPFVALLSTDPLIRAVAALTAGLQLSVAAVSARRVTGGSGLEALVLPIAFTLLCYAMARSMILALWRGGIRWRDTFYRLDDLRRGCVRVFDWPASGAVGWTPPRRKPARPLSIRPG
jgi:hypothetical protein